ncbi:MAG: alpha/beta hydrolase [Ruminococcaceae bacterium]|nr:alpha/beta hydrolase [Oscillospiraceae bacterium]
MAYTKEQKSFISEDKQTEIVYYVYTPDKTPKAVFQIIHGMCEYMERYEHFAEYLCDKGIVVCGCDLRGHGKSAKTKDELGFFGAKKGYEYFSKDTESLRLIMRQKYKRLPYIMLGHSMGSLILRDYIVDHGTDIDGAIIAGTVGGKFPIKKGLALTEFTARFKGGRSKHQSLKDAIMKVFDMEYPEKTPMAWLSRDSQVGIDNDKDEMCNFTFTSRGYNDLLRLYDNVSYPEWAYDVPKSLPIFIISGSDDPIGAKGKGVTEVYKSLEDAEINSLKFKLYDGARHELINETNKEEIFDDIHEWCDEVIEGVVECMKFN